ncbi:uncharacterized protein METZ01_LOCUS132617 [marine metagenome]|uniref:Uncharacterized protein n=1 Tax=marine metagenome TaxID=408172 RepID=A0A381YT85_9ZZZZ
MPQPRSSSRAQRAAALNAGDAVKRGPKTSTSWLNVSHTWDRSSPSSRILATISRSTCSCCGTVAGGDTSKKTRTKDKQAVEKRRFFMSCTPFDVGGCGVICRAAGTTTQVLLVL